MERKRRIFSIFAILIVMTAMSWLLSPDQALCAQISRGKAIRAIIGEAAGEGYEGMLAVACAIRNRGTLRGVYGIKAKHIDRESKLTWILAERAWDESERVDVVDGATHWESTDFKRPVWAKNMSVTARIGKHVFYKKNEGKRIKVACAHSVSRDAAYDDLGTID